MAAYLIRAVAPTWEGPFGCPLAPLILMYASSAVVFAALVGGVVAFAILKCLENWNTTSRNNKSHSLKSTR